jgi:hypothetical protein
VGNNVICVALERTTRMLPNHPHIERVVHEKVSQQRRDWGTLRSPFLPGNECSVHHLDRRLQPPLDVEQNPPFIRVVGNRLEKQIMRNAVEGNPDLLLVSRTFRRR